MSKTNDKLPLTLLKLYFRLAVTLVHEVAHAAHAAVHGNVDIPFETLIISEAGFDWTMCVFGGLPEGDGEHMEEWPHSGYWTDDRANQPRVGVSFLKPTRNKTP